MLGGEVQGGFNNVSTLLQQTQTGKLIPLAVAEPKRMPDLPNVPAIAETIPGFDMAPWVGLIVPAGTPKAIVDKLAIESAAVMHNPAVVKQFTDQQLVVMLLEREKFADLIRKDSEKWGKVIKSAGIKVEGQ
jgi:tripartite-type tricarboxylate transporter receptor subunit TctC